MEETIRTLERRAFAAWPALETVCDDGWVLRFADGYTKRANSANALAPARRPPDEVIADIEAAYAKRGLPPIFRITPLADPAIDAALDLRGYRRFDDSLVMAATMDAARMAPDIAAAATPHDGWLDAFVAAAQASRQTRDKLAALLAAQAPRALFARLGDAAFGMAAVEAGYVGIFEILSVPAARRRGHAKRLVAHLMEWGAANGARTAYLQVAATNAPALALYAALGFSAVYGYHYRLPEKKTAVGARPTAAK